MKQKIFRHRELPPPYFGPSSIKVHIFHLVYNISFWRASPSDSRKKKRKKKYVQVFLRYLLVFLFELDEKGLQK